ncbi:His-Xaa-Ser system radical SAM maturase HxsB [Leptospira noguchii]|uniref:His-Xaa-Ser system radical SAM maturase HxsB n=1 Tax=Leptospira noguchii TaxID=28182 RepID=UPI000387A7A6|nr:His-Xaa-Ser system radical SAM maturase HxsB [Leptospira noguchii]AGS80581.1 His-Xaa-Ser system radical SAM maturase HxsB [Leptospira phage vB_LnoZ_CZ214-LE1]
MFEAKAEDRSRKFKEFEFYDQNKLSSFFLLPFRFHRLNSEKEIIVNEVGDSLILQKGTVEKIVKKQIDKQRDERLYTELITNFFISEVPVDPLIDVLATRYRTKKSFLDDFTSLHIFVVSLRCEHTCQYCQVSRVTQDKDQFDMSFKHIDKAIEHMLNSPSRNITMEFQGGEALLAFDKVKYAIEKTKSISKSIEKNIRYVICTNLALLNDAVLEFCKENKILISTSIDGPGFLHNANRRRPEGNSYELAIKGIDKCRMVLGFDSVSALMTTTVNSLQYPTEIVDEYFNLGFKGLFLRPISPYGFALKNEKRNSYNTSEFINFYKKALNHIIDYNLKGHSFKEDYATIILKKILTPFPVGYVDLNSPAGAITNVIVYNYDGNVYASDEGRMLAEMKDLTFKVGHLDVNTYQELFYGENVQRISRYSVNESLPGCSECAFQSYCGADPVHNHATQGDMVGFRPTNTFCIRNMAIITYIFELMESRPEVKEIFESWVTDN